MRGGVVREKGRKKEERKGEVTVGEERRRECRRKGEKGRRQKRRGREGRVGKGRKKEKEGKGRRTEENWVSLCFLLVPLKSILFKTPIIFKHSSLVKSHYIIKIYHLFWWQLINTQPKGA